MRHETASKEPKRISFEHGDGCMAMKSAALIVSAGVIMALHQHRTDDDDHTPLIAALLTYFIISQKEG